MNVLVQPTADRAGVTVRFRNRRRADAPRNLVYVAEDGCHELRFVAAGDAEDVARAILHYVDDHRPATPRSNGSAERGERHA